MNNNIYKLKWKKRTYDDLSASWLEADVKSLKWTYVVDIAPESNKYTCFLFLEEKACQEVRITSRLFSTQQSAQQFCEDHLFKTYTQLKKLFNTKDGTI